MSELLENIDPEKVPRHVAIIMDGNGRWAKRMGKHRIYGHTTGVESVRESLIAASEAGVEYLTLYAFSTENWNRPKEEVDGLMDLLVQTIAQEIETLNKNEVQLKTIGDLNKLPGNCREQLMEAIDQTSSNKRITLVLALNYSSRWEITEACKKIAQQVKVGNLEVENVTSDIINQHLSTKDIPDPELLIRTSGEQRISNFLLWQLAYTEFYFSKKYWPEFKKEDFFEAVITYQQRERRFGKVSEQINDEVE